MLFPQRRSFRLVCLKYPGFKLSLLCLLLLLQGLVFSKMAVAKDALDVLVVHAYSQDYPWTASQNNGFMQTFTRASGRQVAYRHEYLDTKRVPYTPGYAAFFSDYLATKYHDYQPDLIYVSDDSGYQFARDHLLALFPAATVFFSGVNDYAVAAETAGLPIRGVFEKKDIDINLRLVRNLSEEKTILFVGDGSNTYRVIEAEIKKQLAAYPDIQAHFLVADRLDSLVEALSERNEDYLFLTTIGAIRSARGQILELQQIIDGITGSGDFRILSMEDAYLLGGVIGGYVTSGRRQGETAAELALQFLRDGNINNVSNELNSPNAYLFDQRELDRHGFLLPDGISAKATFQNVPPGFIQRYGAVTLIVFGLLLGFTLLLVIILLLNRYRNMQQLRIEEQRRSETMQRMQTALTDWTGREFSSLEEAFARATELSSQILDVSRVSIWMYENHPRGIACADLYISGVGHSQAPFLAATDFPAYFEAVDKGRALLIPDAMQDPVTRDFIQGYLVPNDIHAMLDMPIFYNGELAGVVCHEHTGDTRVWEDFEVSFATIIAALMSLSLEVDKRKMIEAGLEEEVRMRTREANEANLAKSRFLANMSHELRTPMHSISSFAALGQKQADHPKIRKFFSNIHSSAGRLTLLLNELLDLSKLEAEKMDIRYQHRDMKVLLDKSWQELESLFVDKHLQIGWQTDERVTCDMDSRLITQVLTNLFSNAIKYSPEGGRIDVCLGITLREVRGKPVEMVYFSIMDEGVGIPADQLEAVFDEFFQSTKTRHDGEGTGLGLPITRRIVELHGGSIWAESPPAGKKQGSTIHFYFPRVHAHNEKTAKESPTRMRWSERYSVDNEKLDRQHQQIIRMINRLVDVDLSRNDGSLVRQLIDELYLYINEHLRDEENYMAQIGYPFLAEHRDLHQAFRFRVEQLENDTDKPLAELLPDFLLFLRHWWERHILEEDMQYRRYMETRQTDS